MKWLIQRINTIHDIFGMLDDFGYLKKDALFLWRYKFPFVTSTYEGWEKGNGEMGIMAMGWGTGRTIYLYINIYYEIQK